MPGLSLSASVQSLGQRRPWRVSRPGVTFVRFTRSGAQELTGWYDGCLVTVIHPLLEAGVLREIERAASPSWARLGRRRVHRP